MRYICPVCGYDDLPEPPFTDGLPSYGICPCCGFEFGFDDLAEGHTYEAYRNAWIHKGMPWFRPENKPAGWDSVVQLSRVTDLPNAL